MAALAASLGLEREAPATDFPGSVPVRTWSLFGDWTLTYAAAADGPAAGLRNIGPAVEDAACAGLMASRLMAARPGEWEHNDGALAALALSREFPPATELFLTTAAGRAVQAAGMAEDLDFCARVDTLDIVPVLHERTITLNQAPVAS